MYRKQYHIHFVGIGGIGMSGIAEVLLNLGYHVSGSDLRKSPTTERLSELGGQVHIGHAPEHVQGADVVVISSAVGDENPEVRAAREGAIPVIPRAEMLAELMRLKFGIAVSGTHGKTTTSSMLATALYRAGSSPGFLIGGIVEAFAGNNRIGTGDYFVVEGDEGSIHILNAVSPAFTCAPEFTDWIAEKYIS